MTITPFAESAGQSRYYDFHGIGIAITSERPDLLEALHIRLRHFAVDRLTDTAALTFIFQGAATNQPPIEMPKGVNRRVYGLSLGDVVYNDTEELLYIDWDGGFKALCHSGLGLARISLPAENARLQMATHLLFNLCLFEFLKRRGYYNIHAGGLSIGDQGLLLTGFSGAGKSTVALLRAGFGLLGDDTLFLRQEEEGIRALAFPDEIDVTEQTIGFFSELSGFSKAPKNLRNKAQIAAEQVYQSGWVESCTPRVLLFPKVANTATSVLKPVDPEQALLELACNILFSEPRSSQAHLDVLAGLIKQCDCYRLETGRDFDTLPDRLRELLNSKKEKIL